MPPGQTDHAAQVDCIVMRKFSEEQARALFTVSGITVLKVWQLPNGYWPLAMPGDWHNQGQVSDFVRYAQLRESSPWWLVRTSFGLVKVGWRKRVLNIDWSDTDIREIVTVDDVTKEPTMVHAWSELKAVEYLKRLSEVAAAVST